MSVIKQLQHMLYSPDKHPLPTATLTHKPNIDWLRLINMNRDRQVLAESSPADWAWLCKWTSSGVCYFSVMDTAAVWKYVKN